MSGHSKWKQIKQKKGVTDLKRGQLFSKLLASIRVAAKGDPNPEFNPRLKTAVAKAKEENVPQENIERAIKQSGGKETEELVIEAYGPGGTAMIISAVTDNRNRTIAEIKNILKDFGAKIAEPGSVMWGFEKSADGADWSAKFPQAVDETTREKIGELTEALEQYADVIRVYKNSL